MYFILGRLACCITPPLLMILAPSYVAMEKEEMLAMAQRPKGGR